MDGAIPYLPCHGARVILYQRCEDMSRGRASQVLHQYADVKA